LLDSAAKYAEKQSQEELKKPKKEDKKPNPEAVKEISEALDIPTTSSSQEESSE
jgi:hypothetical protein